MSEPGAARRISWILLDIEGTTTPVRFVTDALFPYARRHLRSHLAALQGSDEYAPMLERLRRERASEEPDSGAVPAWSVHSAADNLAGALAYLEWLMDRDRKSTVLKELQGQIWKQGYERGEIVGEVFPDVPAALHRWHARNVQVGIFSSGSVLAQQLLFRYSSAGDLTGLIHQHFDTRVGAKGDPESYRRIAQSLGAPAEAVLFLSDVSRELDAAAAAGMNVILVVRPGNARVADSLRYRVVHSLDEVTLA